MSKTKKRNLDEIADLKREITDQASIIKSLERQIKKLTEPVPKKESKKKPESVLSENACPSCVKGKLKTVDLGIRKMISCSECGHRMVLKRGQT